MQIVRRGNQLAVMGDARAEAAEVLHAMYQMLTEGRALEHGDIAALIRLGSADLAARADGNVSRRRLEIRTRKKTITPRTEAQQAYTRALLDAELNFGIGPAGTGKTYIAVAAAVQMFADGHVDKIMLSRPAVEAGERLGFLPGDMKEKVDPYMQPLYDALNDFCPASNWPS